jgi:radical SAM-linked protein
MESQKVRIRFRKQGDLRLIGHRDLARTLERLFRRARLPLRMSEGFHPKARLSFPSALALGMEGTDEVLEVQLRCHVESDSFVESLGMHAPAGLSFRSAEVMPANAPKARVKRVRYEISVPAERGPQVQEAIDRLLAESEVFVPRRGRKEPVNLLENLERLELVDDCLHIVQHVTGGASGSPRDILSALAATDLERDGIWLTRTCVELDP